jgi:hypothetical protein
VTVRSHEHTEWDELDVSSRRELTRVFLTEPAVAVVLDALGRRHVADDDVVCWANLMPGDGVLWDATAIEHWTTSRAPTRDQPRPERVVLVGRYFL